MEANVHADGTDEQAFEVLILGAGFAGLAMAIALREQQETLGLPPSKVALLEREPEIGGTWYVNRYPGCACDIPSHLYSYSFARKPDWSRAYAPQAEILDYIREVAERFGVREQVRTGCDVQEARWDDASGRWRVRAADGRRFSAPILITATGGLSRPKWPDLPGMERFGGQTLHTAKWDESVALDGKRVAVIGTGASAIQLVPQIAPRVAQLDLYQRTPPWIMPREDAPIAGWSKRAMTKVPALSWLRREGLRWTKDVRSVAFLRWTGFMGYAQRWCEAHVRAQIADPELRRKVTPDYAVGCKRVLVADDYYPALCRDNVHLHTGGAVAIEADGVRGADDVVRPADVVVYATGFEATRPLPQGVLFGPGGRDLAQYWGDCPFAYRGTAVAGFPNLFFVVGPNTGLGHSSMLIIIEAQARYIRAMLRRVRAEGIDRIEVRAEAESRYNTEIQAKLAKAIWSSGCKSWYITADGRNPTLWPGSTFAFEQSLASVRWEDFSLGVLAEGGGDA